jgi:putative FmdB family regulatory protein
MPMYEYACKSCEHTFEALVFNGETPECPECDGHELERLMSVPGPGKVEEGGLPMASCPPDGSPCGASWCRRK